MTDKYILDSCNDKLYSSVWTEGYFIDITNSDICKFLTFMSATT